MIKVLALLLTQLAAVAYAAIPEIKTPAHSETANYAVEDLVDGTSRTEKHERLGDKVTIRSPLGINAVYTESSDGKETIIDVVGSPTIIKNVFARPVFLLADGEKTSGNHQILKRETGEVLQSLPLTATAKKPWGDISIYIYQLQVGDMLNVKVVAYRTGYRLPIEITYQRYFGKADKPGTNVQLLRTN